MTLDTQSHKSLKSLLSFLGQTNLPLISPHTSSIFWKGSRRRLKKIKGPPPTPLRESIPLLGDVANNNIAAAATGKVKKKAGGARLWMRLDRVGNSELLECDKNAIIKRVAIPARDLRILGPLFSNSSNIFAREKAIVVNLEFIRAIVTAEKKCRQ